MRTIRRVRRALAAGGLALAVAQVGAACDPPAPPAGGPVRLDEGGAGRSAAHLVNDAGQVVGTTDKLAVWASPQGPLTAVDVVPEPPEMMNERGEVVAQVGALGGTTTVGAAINEQGDVVGSTSTGGFGQTRAFLWRDGVLTDLGGLGGAQSAANDVNEDGLIVGTSTDAQGVTHAVTWQR